MATRSSLSDVESLTSFAQLWNFDLVFDNLPPGVSGSLREMTFRCRSTTLPSQELEDMLIELHGVSINRAGRATNDHHFSATFLDSEAWDIRNAFIQWRELIRSWKKNTGSSSDVYATSATIIVYGDDGQDIKREISLKKVWPQSIGEVSFEGNSSGPGELNVTFSYDYIDE